MITISIGKLVCSLLICIGLGVILGLLIAMRIG